MRDKIIIYVTIMKKNIIYDDDYDDNDIHVLIDDWICICMYVCFNVCIYKKHILCISYSSVVI